ncbi:helix-turn-helix transcriptional regulator [Psychroflexus sp. ALD_RP9]|uniref:S24 family peptidase n=1 Tax=Psychroflexus sp. ALD_RP9 TaxID=2777186 RepID=UPI001A8E8CC0|nr:helix-turn-helix transcriptional regulator [Psychroflexus sp. ALD_RP9]QSS96622.1 helix-turn-helix transcriptional regulator [Psychroflexus sp. ALD_RP9]
MQENSIIKKNILKYLDFKGITQYKFHKETGITRGILVQNNGMSEDNTLRFLDYYKEVNPTWLLTGEGSMLKTSKAEPTVDKTGIPLLPLDAFAGLGDTAVDGVDFDTIEERYVVPLFEGIKIDFMLPVRGSSMYPKYSSGDVVACRQVDELLYIQWNKVYVIDTISQGVIMKRLKKSEHPENVICKSDNKDYDPFELPKDDIRNIALVVGVIRLE